jgi:hypothetical protein
LQTFSYLFYNDKGLGKWTEYTNSTKRKSHTYTYYFDSLQPRINNNLAKNRI